MARLEAQSKLLYYPTPPSVVELIASWFSATGQTPPGRSLLRQGRSPGAVRSAGRSRSRNLGHRNLLLPCLQAKKLLDTVLSTSFYDMRPPCRWSQRQRLAGLQQPAL